MTELSFKLEYTIRELRIAPGVTHKFQYGGPHDVSVVLGAPSAADQALGHGSEHAFCTTTSCVTTNQKNGAMFVHIASNQVLSPEADEMTVTMKYSAPDGTQIQLPSLSQFPQHFRSFIDGVTKELVDYV